MSTCMGKLLTKSYLIRIHDHPEEVLLIDITLILYIELFSPPENSHGDARTIFPALSLLRCSFSPSAMSYFGAETLYNDCDRAFCSQYRWIIKTHPPHLICDTGSNCVFQEKTIKNSDWLAISMTIFLSQRFRKM